jgi:hypothetical protein
MQIEVLDRQGQFPFFRRLLNYDEWRIAGKPQSTQFLDYQVVNSNIEAERDHLRVGDHFVRVLTMKEAITETRPLVLDALLKIPASFYVVTEWTPLSADQARKEGNKLRRHFNMSKTGFISHLVSCLGQVITREHLTRAALGRSVSPGDRGVDNLISALRKKLGPGPNGQDRFRSVRSTGYVYVRTIPPHPKESKR